EFGHCFAGRWVDGEASDILQWPLVGLAYVEVPHTPRAHFVTAAGGPLVNLGLCAISANLLIFVLGYWPPLAPWVTENHFPFRAEGGGSVNLYAWATGEQTLVAAQGAGLAAVVL